MKVIIVDDEGWTRDIIKRFGAWESHDMEIVGEAEDGAGALELIEAHTPDIVITDMRMPGIDGVELMRVVKGRYPDIRMIVISGYDDFELARHALLHGAIDYILKPVDATELNAALDRCRLSLLSADKEEQLVIDLEAGLSVKKHMDLLRSLFRDMNQERLIEQFRQLGMEMADKQPSKKELQRLAREFLILLKELMEENSVSVEELRHVAIPDGILSGEELSEFLKAKFVVALDSLVQQRKFKTKLNLEEVRRHIDSRFQEPVALEELAHRFYVSKEYLSKAFKLEYGRNVTDYVLHLRMEKAMEWLADEQIPIKSVAEMAGYEDVSYFYRVFKKHFGMSPGEMRVELKGLK
ncbi:response regulator [Paenibacillus sp. LHD-117]|uniref:response regulator transcription factor n=1 Tax=Paenibacillus sp. LHD-117 TaxID=3071412 RepID=UPI0027E0D8B3|nr:response regulator [Paenibacillus sp. LHD-117]MDQ6418456.1 response regulator [Paenibacillus sp. LHD-117]